VGVFLGVFSFGEGKHGGRIPLSYGKGGQFGLRGGRSPGWRGAELIWGYAEGHTLRPVVMRKGYFGANRGIRFYGLSPTSMLDPGHTPLQSEDEIRLGYPIMDRTRS
jgi:hypothetical protein